MELPLINLLTYLPTALKLNVSRPLIDVSLAPRRKQEGGGGRGDRWDGPCGWPGPQLPPSSEEGGVSTSIIRLTLPPPALSC